MTTYAPLKLEDNWIDCAADKHARHPHIVVGLMSVFIVVVAVCAAVAVSM